MRFGEQLKQWRKDAGGMKQAELQAAIKKSRGYLARVEKGEITPTYPVCVEIAKALAARGLEITGDEVWAKASPAATAARPALFQHFEEELKRQRQEFERRLQEITTITPEEEHILELLRRPNSLSKLLRTASVLQERGDLVVEEWKRRGWTVGLVRRYGDIHEVLNDYLQFILTLAESMARDDLAEKPNVTDAERQEQRDRRLFELLFGLFVVPLDVPESFGAHLVQSTIAMNASVHKAWWVERRKQMEAEQDLVDFIREEDEPEHEERVWTLQEIADVLLQRFGGRKSDASDDDP